MGIVIALIIGILIPDIELVLGLVGSTMGSAISIVFPAAVFIKLTTKDTTERVAAKAVFFIGIITIILGTYVNLFEHSSPTPAPVAPAVGDKPSIVPDTHGGNNVVNVDNLAGSVIKNISDAKAKLEGDKNDGVDPVVDKKVAEDKEELVDKRQEPAVPEAPKEVPTADGIKDEGNDKIKEAVAEDRNEAVDV